jgi:radical SAM superfamily enzyme YgiQ (UPF0313 family)
LEAIGEPLYAGYKTTPSLGIPILTALTPDEHDLHFVDGNIDEIPYDEHFDLVAINCFTPQARFAYEIGDTFRARGVQTVMGGIHPSNYYEDCKSHVDAVVIGEAENIWFDVLEDAKKNKLKPYYKSECCFNLDKYVTPDRRLFIDREGYDWKPLLIQCFRGCDYNCAYCAIPGADGNLRMRPVENIMQEIEQNRDLDGLFIADDQLLLPDEKIEKYAMTFFSALKDINYKKDIFLNASLLLNRNTKLLKVAKDCGINTIYIVLGFDPLSVNAVSFDRPKEAEYNIKLLQDQGFGLFASVGVGLDVDTPDVFKKHIDFLERNNIRHVEFWILTPFPGSPSWEKYKKSDKIITEEFEYYNGSHAVFMPRRMTVEQLEEGFIYLWKEFFTRFPLKPEDALKYYNMTDEYKLKHKVNK